MRGERSLLEASTKNVEKFGGITVFESNHSQRYKNESYWLTLDVFILK